MEGGCGQVLEGAYIQVVENPVSGSCSDSLGGQLLAGLLLCV